MNKYILFGFRLFILLFILIFCGCTFYTKEKMDFSISSFRDIPGITQNEIKSIEGFIERYKLHGIPFIYGVSPSTEAFYDESIAELRGFSVHFCNWLSNLFEVPFELHLYDWDELLENLESGNIDFTGELTATPDRQERFFMTDPIATRLITYFRIAGSEPLASIERQRPIRYGFFTGTTTYNDVFMERSTGYFIPVFANNYDEAYNLLITGEVDAFLDEHTSEGAYDRFGNVTVESFLPLIYSPVSLSTRKEENKAVISVVQRILELEGVQRFVEMYNLGELEYKRHKLFSKLTEEEKYFLQNNKIIDFAAEHDNYPVSFYNVHDQEFQGICFDILKRIESLTGLYFNLVNNQYDEWNVILKMLEDGEASFISELIRTPEREKTFLFSSVPFLIDYHALLSKEDQPFRRINEIMYERVGLINGYAHTYLFKEWFPNHAFTVVYDSLTQAFNGLDQNEIDLVMASQNKLMVMTNFYESPGYKANIVFDYPYPSLFGFNKNESVLASIIDKSLEIINTADIENQWRGKTYDYRKRLEQEQTRLHWLIGAFLVFIIGFVVFLLYRNKEYEKIQEESISKSIFLANMSHEIRTPMNAITGMAEMLLRGDLPEDLRGYAQDIKHAGNNLISIINDILDISKIEAGKLEIIPVHYALSSLVNDTVNIIRAHLSDKNLAFEINIDKDIPNNLIGDEVRLRQIILNLLSNAVKYTENGGVVFSITIEKMTLGSSLDIDSFINQVWLKIEVTDTGKGIKPEDQKKLFNKFVQVDKEKNIGIEGTGLGLSITKQLCDIMGGSISVQSEYGEGSTFTVLIPQGIASPEPIQDINFTGSSSNENTFKITNLFPYARILVVDDLPVNLKVAEGLLNPYKAVIDVCASGFEAIELIKYQKYDLIFMDHMMPEMDGIEATKKIREFGYNMPIVALTANAIAGMKDKFIANGFNDFLPKPIDIYKLDEILNRWIPEDKKNESTENKTKGNQQNKSIPILKLNESNTKTTTNLIRQKIKNTDILQTGISNEFNINTESIKIKRNTGKGFRVFSIFLFLFISIIAFIAYTITARQINLNYIEQQLSIASETIKLRLTTIVNSELSLVLKMADTPAIKNYFIDPSNEHYKSLAENEIYLFEQHFKSRQAFWVSDKDKLFYSTNNEPYLLEPDDPEHYWYDMTLYETDVYNVNINYNRHMREINLWVNVPVFKESKNGKPNNDNLTPIGMLGTGIDLTEFSEFVAFGYRDTDQKITPYIFNRFYEITTALNYDLIYNKIRIDTHLGDAGARLIRSTQRLDDNGNIRFIFNRNVYFLSYIPSLEWYLVLIHPEPGLLALNDTMNSIFFSMLFLILLMFIIINIFIYRSGNAIAEQNIKLIEANKKAQEASQAKTDFLGKISHEIRTPINTITGMNELILRSDIPDDIRSYAMDIKKAGASLTVIINEILNFSESNINKLDQILVRRENTLNTNEKAKDDNILIISGIDTKKGLAQTGGKIELYKQVLLTFCEDIEERVPILQKELNKKNLSLFNTQVHALKGAAATIGAADISSLALKLEEASNNEDISFIKEKLPLFLSKLSDIKNKIEEALE